MTEPRVFVFGGHGDDFSQLYGTNPLPPGYTLVTFSTCATPTTIGTGYKLFKEMAKNGVEFFKDPADPIRRAEIEKVVGEIRVYEKCADYPNLWYASKGVYPAGVLSNYDFLYKSGVYELPFELEKPAEWTSPTPGSLEETLLDKKGLDVTTYGYLREKPSSEDLKAKYADGLTKSYTGAVFPDADAIRKIVEGGSDVVSIADVFKALGPGVYYWPVCRGNMTAKTIEEKGKIEKHRRQSDGDQLTNRLKRLIGLSTNACPKQGGRKRKTWRKKRRMRKTRRRY